MTITKTKPCQPCFDAGEQIYTALESDIWRCEAGHEEPVSGAEHMRMHGAAPLFEDDPRDPDDEYDRRRDNR